MKLVKPKIASAIKYHGGKFYLANKIIPLMEYRPIFVDGFCGALNIALNIDEKFEKIYAFDKNPDLIKMWQSLQSQGDSVLSYLRATKYSEIIFKYAKNNIKYHVNYFHDWHFAGMYIINYRFSRGGLGKTFAWSKRLRGGKPGDQNAWENFVQNGLPRVIEKIQPIHFECGCFAYLIRKYDLEYNPDVVFYVDPPYVKESKTATKCYDEYEMKTLPLNFMCEGFTHLDLIGTLKQISGKFYLSGYHNWLYDKWTNCSRKIQLVEFPVKNNAGQNKVKQDRTEVLWHN